MRAGILKCIKISIFLSVFALFLCLPALSKTRTASAAAPEVKISVKSVSIVKGGYFSLKVYNTGKLHTVEFSSKDESIATVSPKGVISGVACGTTVVTATVSEGGKLTAELY
ncbi:MAG: Ig-like domain-containing protein [Lachnospiraceae bacterium]|nr:Ig-like domain-containing protein [Lachnospiraceae bacterium]